MKKLPTRYLTVIFSLALTFSAISINAATEPVLDGEISGELNIHCFGVAENNHFLNAAAASFEQKYHGTTVNIIGFSTLTSPMLSDASSADYSYKAESDYINRVNVEMMSGGGGDIYLTDVLPVYKYADSGQLVDLREFMDSDPEFNYDDYHKSVFDAVMYRGGQYILPTEYDFNILSYDTLLLDKPGKGRLDSIGKFTYEQLFDIGADSFLKHNDPTDPVAIMKMNDASNMFNYQLRINFNVFVDVENRKANFTDSKFARILNSVKEYEQKGYYGKTDNISSMDFESMNPTEQQRYILAMTQIDDIYKLSPSFMLLPGLISGNRNAPQSILGETTRKYEVFGLLANINGDVPVDILYSYAMNSNSGNKRMAWEFLKFLISEEMQGLRYVGEMMTVNKNAFVTNAKTVIYNALSADRYRLEPLPDDVALTESQQMVLDRYLYYTDRFLSMLNTHIDDDYIVRRMIYYEVEKYFDGNRTADEVANILQSRIGMYLQE